MHLSIGPVKRLNLRQDPRSPAKLCKIWQKKKRRITLLYKVPNFNLVLHLYNFSFLYFFPLFWTFHKCKNINNNKLTRKMKSSLLQYQSCMFTEQPPISVLNNCLVSFRDTWPVWAHKWNGEICNVLCGCSFVCSRIRSNKRGKKLSFWFPSCLHFSTVMLCNTTL